MSTPCTLSILVARTDTAFMMHTIPHIVNACRYPFTERVLLVDTAPLGRTYRRRPHIGTMAELMQNCERLQREGVIDRIEPINYSRRFRMRIYRKHFGRTLWQTHDLRGYPILGSIQALETAPTDHVVHFDSDILLHQDRDFNWIEEGVQALNNRGNFAAVLPRSGPPRPDGRLTQQEDIGEAHVRDGRGFFLFDTFTSRVYLADRRRLEQLLPLELNRSLRRRIREWLRRINSLPPWEELIGRRLEGTSYVRADMNTDRAWTIHCADRGEAFLDALPGIIRDVEAGRYPPAQGGFYDLRLEEWSNKEVHA